MKKNMVRLIIGMFFITVCLPLHSQTQPSKAERDADMYIQYQNFDKAADLYGSALNKASDQETRNRINLKLATMYYSIRRYSEAASSYDAVYISNTTTLSVFSKQQAVDYASSLLRTNQIKQVTEVVKAFTATQPFSTDVPMLNLERGLKYLDDPQKGVSLSKASFNKPGSTFWCTSYDNGVLFLNTGTSEREMLKGAAFYYYNGSETSKYDKVQETLQAGPATFSADKNTMLYTDNRYGSKAPNKLKTEKLINNTLQLVELKYNSKKQAWDEPSELFKDQVDYSFCHPALSKDGNTLYFASNMNEGSGMDLFMSRRTNNGWSSPANVGDVVNTKGEEVFPSIYENYLIFSSNGQEGFGGQDIYAVQLTANGLPIAGTLSQLPSPINSVYNDYALMNLDENKGYFTSDRPDGSNMDAIYTWGQNRDIVSNIFDGKPTLVAQAKVEPAPVPVAVVEPVKPPVVVEPAPKTGSEVADDLASGSDKPDATVYFEFSKSVLTANAKLALNDFADKYKNKRVKLIVVGYTDIIGSDSSNEQLSKYRASTVKQYLMSKGFDAMLIETHGRGKLYLTADQQLEGRSLIEKLAPARVAEVKAMPIK